MYALFILWQFQSCKQLKHIHSRHVFQVSFPILATPIFVSFKKWVFPPLTTDPNCCSKMLMYVRPCTWTWAISERSHLLKKKLSPCQSPSSDLLSVAPQVGVWPVSSFPPVLEYWVTWSCIGFVKLQYIPKWNGYICPEDIVVKQSSLISVSYNFVITSPMVFSKPWVRVCVISMSIWAWGIHSHSLFVLWPNVVSINFFPGWGGGFSEECWEL